VFEVDSYGTTGARHAKFLCVDMTYTCGMSYLNYYLYINRVKHGDWTEFDFVLNKINVDRICNNKYLKKSKRFEIHPYFG
jgi:hypothetical protein